MTPGANVVCKADVTSCAFHIFLRCILDLVSVVVEISSFVDVAVRGSISGTICLQYVYRKYMALVRKIGPVMHTSVVRDGTSLNHVRIVLTHASKHLKHVNSALAGSHFSPEGFGTCGRAFHFRQVSPQHLHVPLGLHLQAVPSLD